MDTVKWYEKTIVVILLCLVIPPLGLVIAWRRTKQSRALIALGAFTTLFFLSKVFVKEQVSTTPIEEVKGLTANHLENLTRSDILDPNISDREMEYFLNYPGATYVTHRGLKVFAIDSKSIPKNRMTRLLGLIGTWQDKLDPFIGHIVYSYDEENLFNLNIYLKPEYITDHSDHYDKLKLISSESYLMNKNLVDKLTVWVYNPFYINGTTDMDSKHFKSYAYSISIKYFDTSNHDIVLSYYGEPETWLSE